MSIPTIVMAATQSGSGKTTIVTGLIAALRDRGLKVQPYKIGPDYIDPGYHSIAAGRPAHNLDSWLIPKERLKELFAKTSQDADIAIIEGVMGLYDGGKNGISSTAEIAKLLKAPVILIIDAKSMAASAAALALGFREYDKNLNLAGVILNRIGSDNHRVIIEDALSEINIKCFGAIKRDNKLITPERHLGLLPTTENDTLNLIKNISAAVSSQLNLNSIIEVARANATVDLINKNSMHKSKSTVKIAVAKDEAFSFYYPESLNVLEDFGAEIINFSPLHDKELPKVQGLIIGGGFPEMFAQQLEANISMRESIKSAADNHMPIFAECGGYMYLMNELVDFSGRSYQMTGIINTQAKMNDKLQMVGYVKGEIMTDCVIGNKGDILHAHEFHFSSAEEIAGQQIFNCVKMRNNISYQAGFYNENITASYLHIHFAGCPQAAAKFLQCCKNYPGGNQ